MPAAKAGSVPGKFAEKAAREMREPRRQAVAPRWRCKTGTADVSLRGGQLLGDQGDGNESRPVELVQEPLQREVAAELLRTRGDELVHLYLADHIARPVPGLLQIEMLLGPDRLAVEP